MIYSGTYTESRVLTYTPMSTVLVPKRYIASPDSPTAGGPASIAFITQ